MCPGPWFPLCPALSLAVLLAAPQARANTTGSQTAPPPCSTSSPQTCCERVERYRALGLPERDLPAFIRSKRSLTEWYNHEYIGGQKLRGAGWLIFVLGAVTTTIGAAVLIFARTTREKCEECDNLTEIYISILLGVPITAAGIIEMNIGLPMALVGESRVRRWVKDDWLDRAPLDTLRKHGQHSSRAGSGLTLTPYLAPGGGGLSLSLQF